MNGQVSIAIRPFLESILHLRTRRTIETRKWLGSVVALAVGLWVWQLPPPEPLDGNAMHFLGTLAGAVVLWAFDVLDEYLVALMLLLSWTALRIVPPETALAGFSQKSWFFAVAVLGMAAGANKSGLFHRMALRLIRRISPNHYLYSVLLAVAGMIATPFLPNVKARMSIAAPLSQAISESLGFQARSNGSAGITLSAYIGFSQMSMMFLTGTTACLIGWNLLPEAAKSQFSWAAWLVAALPAGLAMFVLMLLGIMVLFPLKDGEAARVSKDAIEDSMRGRAPLSSEEKVVLVVLFLAFVGWLGKPLHGISEFAVALAGLVAILLSGTLNKTDFKTSIDWGFLVFFGTMSSVAAVVHHVGIDYWLRDTVMVAAGGLLENQVTFLLAALLLMYFVRFFVDKIAAVILLTLALAPWAEPMGIHPGVLLLTILFGVEAWFLPYQTRSYLIAYYSSEGKAFSHAQARKLMVLKFIASFAALLISIPYWRMLGLLE